MACDLLVVGVAVGLDPGQVIPRMVATMLPFIQREQPATQATGKDAQD